MWRNAQPGYVDLQVRAVLGALTYAPRAQCVVMMRQDS